MIMFFLVFVSIVDILDRDLWLIDCVFVFIDMWWFVFIFLNGLFERFGISGLCSGIFICIGFIGCFCVFLVVWLVSVWIYFSICGDFLGRVEFVKNLIKLLNKKCWLIVCGVFILCSLWGWLVVNIIIGIFE